MLGAMIMGPLGGYAIKKFDQLFQKRIKSGFEMLVNNFSAGLIGFVGGCTDCQCSCIQTKNLGRFNCQPIDYLFQCELSAILCEYLPGDNGGVPDSMCKWLQIQPLRSQLNDARNCNHAKAKSVLLDSKGWFYVWLVISIVAVFVTYQVPSLGFR